MLFINKHSFYQQFQMLFCITAFVALLMFASSNQKSVNSTVSLSQKDTYLRGPVIEKIGKTLDSTADGPALTHSLEECSTSRMAPRCGHLPLSPTHLTSTPAVGQ